MPTDTISATPAAPDSTVSGRAGLPDDATRLLLIYLSRFGVSVAMMCYAGALPFLMRAWHMSSTEAGSVQSAYNICYALSLLVSSWLADRLGAARVFRISGVLSAVVFVAFVLWARSYASALWLYALVAVAVGGTYGTSLMLVSALVPAARRGRAIGWNLAAASLGYLGGIFITVALASRFSYEWGLAVCALGPLLAAFAGGRAVAGMHDGPAMRAAPAAPASQTAGAAPEEGIWNRAAVILTLGYTAHCWELLGMWAWTPAFLSAALEGGALGGVALALAIALSLHLGGAAATATMGPASDRWGRRPILIAMAVTGASFSLLYGWLPGQSPAVLLALTFVYSFTVLGDSGVLSTAMTEAVPPRRLGTALAFRSVFGFGAGALSPLAFGRILDAFGGPAGHPEAWGWAFTSLGIGGAIAAACAIALRMPPRRG